MFAPQGPIDECPYGSATPEEREQALLDALTGVQLGDYDGRIIAWMLAMFDTPTLKVVVSLLGRCRGAGMVDAIRLQAALDARRDDDDPHHGRES